MSIYAAIRSTSIQVANEAIYYCIRALKQAKLPLLTRKEYFFDSGESAPSLEIVQLASDILKWIAESENNPIENLDDKIILKYIHELSKFIYDYRLESTSVDISKGADRLRQLDNMGL